MTITPRTRQAVRRTGGPIVTLMAAALSVVSAQPAPTTLHPLSSSRLSLDGTSTVHDYTCTTGDISADIRVDSGFPFDGPPGDQSVRSVTVTLPVHGFKCNHGTGMDDNFYKAMRADQFPAITYAVLTSVVAPTSVADSLAVHLTGTLTVAGTAKPESLDATVVRASDGSARVTGQIDLLMTDFGIKPPTMLLGTIKTGNRITIRFALLLSASTMHASAGRDVP